VWLQEFGKEEMRGGVAAKGVENEGGLGGKGAARVREG
jgi:hypothetical protein